MTETGLLTVGTFKKPRFRPLLSKFLKPYLICCNSTGYPNGAFYWQKYFEMKLKRNAMKEHSKPTGDFILCYRCKK